MIIIIIIIIIINRGALRSLPGLDENPRGAVLASFSE